MTDDEIPGGDGCPGADPEDDRPVGADDGTPGGDGSDRDDQDPVRAELQSLFAAALADEPPSRVSPLSVLRIARSEEADRRRTRVTLIRRWGGAAVAAAAIIVAVVLVGPVLSHRGASSADSTGAAAGSASSSGFAGGASASAASGSASSGAGSAVGSASSAGSATASSGFAASAGGAEAAEGSAPNASSGGAASSGSAESSASSVSRATSGTAGSAVAPEGASAAPTEAPLDCMVEGLFEAQLAAADRALGAGTVTNAPGTLFPVLLPRCDQGTWSSYGVNGGILHTKWPSGTVTVMVFTPYCLPCYCDQCPKAASSPEPSAGDQAAMNKAVVAQQRAGEKFVRDQQRIEGSKTVTKQRGATRVVVIANPAAAAHLTKARLTSVATAVLDATH